MIWLQPGFCADVHLGTVGNFCQVCFFIYNTSTIHDELSVCPFGLRFSVFRFGEDDFKGELMLWSTMRLFLVTDSLGRAKCRALLLKKSSERCSDDFADSIMEIRGANLSAF